MSKLVKRTEERQSLSEERLPVGEKDSVEEGGVLLMMHILGGYLV